ncbi:MAG TPA: VanW family protein [Fimbriimonadales bacterium]|nr:VanW family protein [Fimbriimonadales bacterium]
MEKSIRRVKAFWLLLTIVPVVALAGGLAAYVAIQEPVTPKGLVLEGMPVGELTKNELHEKLITWWSQKKNRLLYPKSHLLSSPPGPISFERAGIRPDFEKILEKAPFVSPIGKLLDRDPTQQELEIFWKLEKVDYGFLEAFVERVTPKPRPASVEYRDGQIFVQHEITPTRLETKEIGERILIAVRNGKDEFELPLYREAPRYPSEALNTITDVVSEFTTAFKTSQANRSANIALAASKLNGKILMPGEKLSFNETVGKRLRSEGFKLAPVYVAGRHEQGLGGGICQVCTTLYNTVLFANLEILKRQNHSMPVPYVPIGRDATVNWGSIDLVFRNSYKTPIAIVSEVKKGKLTFRILGKKDPTISVSLITTDHASWGNGVKYVFDPSLPAGKKKVIEKGSMGRRCVTWRIVRKNGKEIKREKLGVSIYKAFPRIVAYGPKEEEEIIGTDEEPPTTPPDDGEE